MQKPIADDFDSYQKAKDYYQSCVDEDHREELGVQPLAKLLRDLGGWPVLEGDNFDGWEMANGQLLSQQNLEAIN